ncbi:MAG: T9SS type A sorting domain-containing protein [Saprospiraceae bacterium]|nr:T9SS type A sorting domain-containing protein [Saprospiraceae bacterium]
MNVHLLQPRIRELLFAVFIVLGAGVPVSAQSGAYRNLITAINTEVADTIAGMNLAVTQVNPLAQNGDVDITILQSGGSGNPYIYQIKYTPDPGFTGVDTFALQLHYVGNFPYLVYKAYRVSVYPSLVTGRPDFAITTVGTPVAIDVLSNDEGTQMPLYVSEIPLVNNGTASINASGQVVFTPDAGFTGVAHVNYVVCDAVNTCKTVQVNIGVNNSAPSSDTIRVATGKNTKLVIPLTYDGYTLFQAPTHGVVVLPNSQSFSYSPDINYTGTDQFVLSLNYSGTTVYKTVILDVLNTPTQNTMAMDDYVFTPTDEPITFNVRENDIGNLLVKSWVTPATLQGTISNTNGSGDVTFTPNPGFNGVATFYYRIGNMYVSNLEMAAVNVIVGNMNPAAATYDLTTPRETPFVINYQIPFIGFDFSIVDPPDNGFCSFFPGYTTQDINGQSVSGYNLLVYTPDNDFIGTDEFEVTYCLTANGQCRNVKVVMNVVDVFSSNGPYCINDCVWAGDVNSDGIVNNKDILPLGYYLGFDGFVRPDASLEWYGQYAENWDNPYTGSPVDAKHADTDGDGTIRTDDTLAISLFYGQTHNFVPLIPPTAKNLPFYYNVLTPDPQVGDLVEVEVSLGSAVHPVIDVYGFTFDLTLSPTIKDSALNMTYYNNSWLNLNSPSLWFEKNPQQGRLETAFTRTGGLSASGYGIIGKFDFIVIDIIHGAKPYEKPHLKVTVDPTLMWGDGATTAGGAQVLEIPLRSEPQADKPSTENDLFVYPSPASDRVSVHLNGSETIESLSVFDATGKTVYDSGETSAEHLDLNVADFPEGFYVVTVQTQSGRFVKKIQVQR